MAIKTFRKCDLVSRQKVKGGSAWACPAEASYICTVAAPNDLRRSFDVCTSDLSEMVAALLASAPDDASVSVTRIPRHG